MLTTAEKLSRKDNQMLLRKNYLNVDLDNDMIDYAKPSRILMNRYSNNTYWPEYDVSKNIKVNENQQETYEMENLSCKYNISFLLFIDVVTNLKTLFYSTSSGDGLHTVIISQKCWKSRLNFKSYSQCVI